MIAQWIFDMFDNDKDWLAHQPGMNPWKPGCTTLCEQLNERLAEYSEPMCEQVITADHADYQAYLRRTWGCWGHHWRQAAETMPEKMIDGREVAEQIRSGRGYQRGGKLGGDPLRDIVLAEAVLKWDNRATTHFQSDYYEFSRKLAGSKDRRLYLDADDWWNEFFDFLAGYTAPPGKLERFMGKCALQNWLGTVLWNFLRRRPLPEGEGNEQLEDIGDVPGAQPDDPSLRECIDLFVQLVNGALGGLPDEYRLVLCLLSVDGLKLKETAAILGVHSGNAGKRRDRAIERLKDLLDEHAAKLNREQSYQDCQDYLMEDSKNFANALREALERHYRQEDKQ